MEDMMTFDDLMLSQRGTYKPSDDSMQDRLLRRCWDAARNGHQAPRKSWDVLRVTCKGPCWNGVWFVFQKRGEDVGPYLLNEAGNPKRFRSEEAARKVADKLNRGAL